MAISMLISSFFIISNGVLIGFHVYLNTKDLTTYEYILEKRKKTSVSYMQKIRANEEIRKHYEPYAAFSKSEESIELVRSPNFLEKSLDATKVVEPHKD